MGDKRGIVVHQTYKIDVTIRNDIGRERSNVPKERVCGAKPGGSN